MSQQNQQDDQITIYYFPRINCQVSTQVSNNESVQKTIAKAIKQLQDQYLLHMNLNPNQYRLFPSKKNGKKDDDLPQVQAGQKLKNTGVNTFCLEQILRTQSKFQIPNLQKKYGINFKNNRKISEDAPCFCIKLWNK